MNVVERRKRWIKLSGFCEPNDVNVWLQFTHLAARVMPPSILNPALSPEEASTKVAAELSQHFVRRSRLALAYSAFDVEQKAAWEDALRASRWVEFSCADRHVLDERMPCVTCPPTALNAHFQPVSSTPTDTVLEIFGSIWRDTLDPFGAIRMRNPTGYIADLQAQNMIVNIGIGFLQTAPIAIAIMGLATEKSGERSGWVLDIGVNPMHRRQGNGAYLLSRTVSELRTLGAKRVFSVIDRRNTASLRMHEKLGFATLDGPFLTFVFPVASLPASPTAPRDSTY